MYVMDFVPIQRENIVYMRIDSTLLIIPIYRQKAQRCKGGEIVQEWWYVLFPNLIPLAQKEYVLAQWQSYDPSSADF
jgi:hypothetical protein